MNLPKNILIDLEIAFTYVNNAYLKLNEILISDTQGNRDLIFKYGRSLIQLEMIRCVNIKKSLEKSLKNYKVFDKKI